MRVHLLVVLAAGVLSTPVVLKERRGRGLLDFLEGDMAPEPTMVVTAGPGPENPPVVGEYPLAGQLTRPQKRWSRQCSTTGTKTGEGRERTWNFNLHSWAYHSATLVAATNKDVSATPPGELAQWKVIGISIICVTVRRYHHNGCDGRDKGMRSGMENLSPDWDRRTWEFKLASEDGHRYPTLTSMDSMTKV
ncbi:hypothetical protein FA13DRAFT_1747992 [Coprinellus micaceus]|uniref:Uncharacterized protein n=1 Tax=Coprinellus micaceus TaxID=71717 RepID=A0A4Y7S024_COPMI|nr:hypothetical protein FA13DRAFT_1747992 [Coprinellus micaceus]